MPALSYKCKRLPPMPLNLFTRSLVSTIRLEANALLFFGMRWALSNQLWKISILKMLISGKMLTGF